MTGCAAVVFYGYAALRGVPWASWALTAALAGLAFMSPANPRLDQFMAPQPVLLLAAALFQLALGIWRRDARHCLAGSLLAALTMSYALGADATLYRGVIAYHLVVTAVLFVGAVFDDPFARFLRVVGALLVLLGCLAAL